MHDGRGSVDRGFRFKCLSCGDSSNCNVVIHVSKSHVWAEGRHAIGKKMEHKKRGAFTAEVAAILQGFWPRYVECLGKWLSSNKAGTQIGKYIHGSPPPSMDQLKSAHRRAKQKVAQDLENLTGAAMEESFKKEFRSVADWLAIFGNDLKNEQWRKSQMKNPSREVLFVACGVTDESKLCASFTSAAHIIFALEHQLRGHTSDAPVISTGARYRQMLPEA